MKTKFLSIPILFALGLFALPLFAAEKTETAPTDAPSAIQKELGELVARIQAKITEGQRSEEQLANELKEFDALIERHSAEKSEEVATALLMQSLLYLQILNNEEKGTALVEKLKKDFPDTEAGQRAESILASIERQKEAEKVRADLQVGKPFPDFNVTDLEGKPLSVSKFKGKVVLVDFWATWCGPCLHELPNLHAAYKEYHDDGFEIISISLDREREKLTSFVKRENMTWPQHYDEEGKLAGKYGVTSIPTTYLLDAKGNIAAKNLRGNQLSKEVARLLGK